MTSSKGTSSGTRTRAQQREDADYSTVSDSASLGKKARKAVPLASHAKFEPATDRTDPVEVLERQSQTRVPDLVPIRYGRMLVSPFTFYRGAAAIMAGDLASTPQSGLQVQCCGDAHLSNFGVFGSPGRRLVFDINDFDETHPGPWEWDVKRLSASMLIASQSNSFSKKDQRRVVIEAVGSYRASMASFAAMGTLEVWYSHFDVEDVLRKYAKDISAKAVKGTKKALAKARTRDSISALAKLTGVVDGEVRIVDQSPLIVPIDRIARGVERGRIFDELVRLLGTYRDTLPMERRRLFDRFRLVDAARKVVGVGSVGTEAWIALLLGPDGKEPLFLQVKQAEASVLEEFTAPSEFGHQGERVVAGQRLMQAESDIFLGWLRADTDSDERRDYYCRQLKDWKGSAEVERMDPRSLAVYGQMCGWTLARAHARSGDPVAIASYLDDGDAFDRAILTFSEAYAAQNERDYRALTDAVSTGRIKAETGV
jgi:uncharacterized protein (DUF2252 family)